MMETEPLTLCEKNDLYEHARSLLLKLVKAHIEKMELEKVTDQRCVPEIIARIVHGHVLAERRLFESIMAIETQNP